MKWLISGVHALSSVLKVGNTHFVEYLSHKSGEEVLYLPAPLSPLHYMFKRDDDRFVERRQSRMPLDLQVNVREYTPLTCLPVLRQWPLNTRSVLKRSLKVTIPDLKKVLEAVDFLEPDVLVTTNLQYAYLDNLVQPRRHIYWCKDDIRAFIHAPACLAQAEMELMGRVDAAVATSQHLADCLRERCGRHVDCIRNGADVERFRGGRAEDAPGAVQNCPEPRVIYAGILNERLQIDWISQAAAAMPEVSFLLVGPVETELNALSSLRNVYLTGPISPSDLSSVYAACAVGMIPFRRTPLVEATCPIKLYEYLASGLPVVASRWRELEDMASPALLADNADAFVDQLRLALAVSKNAAQRDQRKRYAALHSWDRRFDEIYNIFASA